MLPEELNQLLESRYSPLETGYCRLPNGQMHIAVLTRMPGCKGEMVDWWFGHLSDSDTFRAWYPKSHLSLEWDRNWIPGHYIGASHIVEERIENIILKTRIHFHDPNVLFDKSILDNTGTVTAICANVYDLEKIPYGFVIHIARDTDYGCEMKSHLWLFNASDNTGMDFMIHYIEKMGRLAEILPNLHQKSNNDERIRNF